MPFTRLRAHLWERGDAILQADNEGFTNEEGFHIVWQFSDSVSGAWNMAVLQDGTWHHFKMDLGDPDHREAFLQRRSAGGLSAIRATRSRHDNIIGRRKFALAIAAVLAVTQRRTIRSLKST